MNIVQANNIFNKLMVCALKEAFSENTYTKIQITEIQPCT